MPQITLPQGTVRYSESGSGDTIVLVHGALVDGRLWRKVVPLLDGDFRVVVPDLPLGAHKVPLNESADRTPPGMAKLLADFLEALDLRDVTLVGNDTGGVLCQLVATRHPERVGRLVLTPTDAFDNFLPKLFKPLQLAAKVPPLLLAAVQPLRLAPLRRLPIAFGWLSKTPTDPAVEADWVRSFFADAGVRRDIIGLLAAVDTRYTLEAAAALRSFDKPVLIAWAREDKVFPPAHAERFAALIPGARLEWIEDSYTFVSEDQPVRVAKLIRDFVREPVAA
jgi:pimeloyl-ACP methyl ester carboxylesterase